MGNELRVPKTTRRQSQVRGMVSGEVALPPVAELIGLRMVRADLGLSVRRLDPSTRHANPMGTLHGGIICDLADAAMGTAVATTLKDNETFTPVDLTSKFFKPALRSRAANWTRYATTRGVPPMTGSRAACCRSRPVAVARRARRSRVPTAPPRGYHAPPGRPR